MIPIIYDSISVNELILNEGETARRLQVEKGFKSEIIDRCLCELKQVVNCKYSAVLTDISYFVIRKIVGVLVTFSFMMFGDVSSFSL